VLALTLQSSTCHFHYCSGDCNDKDDDEEEDDDGSQTEMLVLPPLRDPFGRPMTGPIPVLLWIEPRAEHRER